MLLESPETAQRIRGILDGLLAERERLRTAGDASATRANSLAIAYWRQALARLEDEPRRR